MSSAKQQYQMGYQLARKVRHRPGPLNLTTERFQRVGLSMFWRAFWSLEQRRAYPPRYHWENARRGEIFRSSLYLRYHDIPF